MRTCDSIEFSQAGIHDADPHNEKVRQTTTTLPATVDTDDNAHGMEKQTQRANEAKSGMLSLLSTSDLSVDAAAAPRSHVPGNALVERLKQARSSQADETFDTQSSNVPGMKKALTAMMLPEVITQGDTQTQQFPPQPPSESAEGPNFDDLSPLHKETPETPFRRDKPALSQFAAQVLENAKPELRQIALALAIAKSSTKKTSDLILCQCGYDRDEGDMVSCVV